MKIELKRDSFKYLSEVIQRSSLGKDWLLDSIFEKELKPQYNKAFKQYNESPKFKVGDKVINTWGFKGHINTLNPYDFGIIKKITKDKNGRVWYHVKYKYCDDLNEEGNVISTNYLTTKYRHNFLKKVI